MKCEPSSDEIFEILILMRADKMTLEDAWASIMGRKPTHAEVLAVDVKVLKLREGWVQINQNIRKLDGWPRPSCFGTVLVRDACMSCAFGIECEAGKAVKAEQRRKKVPVVQLDRTQASGACNPRSNRGGDTK